MSSLNPQIRMMEVGTKELREVTIYPLSMADQFKMTDAVVNVFKQFDELKPMELGDAAIVVAVISLIEENIQTILELIIDEEEKLEFSELTNLQFSLLVENIYEVNYAGTIKKFQDLVGRVKELLPAPAMIDQPTGTENPSQ